MTFKELLATVKSHLRPKNKQVYYKVVLFHEEEGRYVSCSPCQGGSLEYHTDKFTHMLPGSFGLFVVGDLESAKGLAQASACIGERGKVFTCHLWGPVVKANYALFLNGNVRAVSFLPGVTREEKFRSASDVAWEESMDASWVNRTFASPPLFSYTVRSLKLRKCVYTHEWGGIDI